MMITKTCPECQGVIEIDETHQIPGSTVEATCQLCGFTVMVEIPRSVARQNEAQQNLMAEQNTEHEKDLLRRDEEFQLLKLEVERLKKQAKEAQKPVVPAIPAIPRPQMPPIPAMNNFVAPPVYLQGGKSNVTAGILALFFGGLGVHKFYLNKPVWGILYLIFCWTYIPSILGLFEGIVYFSTNKETFAARYR